MSKWTPCSERLPNIGDLVIISGKMKYKDDKDYEYFVDVAVYEPSQEFSTFNDWNEGQDEYEITAWQPLPEPYEECRTMKIGDEVYVHGYIDEIRNDVIIIRNDGGYFGTVTSEVMEKEETLQNLTKPNKSDLRGVKKNDSKRIKR